MPKRGVKKKDGEKLDDANIERVIGLLNQEKPITKKAACEALNISYNSTRLTRIIDEYHERKERRRKTLQRIVAAHLIIAKLSVSLRGT